MLAHVDFNVEIAGRATVAARFALARDADTIAGVDAGRNLDRQRFGATDATLAQTRVTGVADDRSGAAAARARLLQLKEALEMRTWPLPWHVSQVSAVLPFAAPVPLQTSHSASRGTSISADMPNTA